MKTGVLSHPEIQCTSSPPSPDNKHKTVSYVDLSHCDLNNGGDLTVSEMGQQELQVVLSELDKVPFLCSMRGTAAKVCETILR